MVALLLIIAVLQLAGCAQTPSGSTSKEVGGDNGAPARVERLGQTLGSLGRTNVMGRISADATEEGGLIIPTWLILPHQKLVEASYGGQPTLHTPG